MSSCTQSPSVVCVQGEHVVGGSCRRQVGAQLQSRGGTNKAAGTTWKVSPRGRRTRPALAPGLKLLMGRLYGPPRSHVTSSLPCEVLPGPQCVNKASSAVLPLFSV